MRVCPKCQTKYTDDSLNYCLQDGETLEKAGDEKTLILDADSFANEATISDNFSEREIDQKGKTGNTVRSTAENRSIETVTSRVKTEGSSQAFQPTKRRMSGVGFLAGVALSLLVIAVVSAGVYFVWNSSNSTNGNSNASNRASDSSPTRILTDSAEVKVSASSTRETDKGNIYTPQMAFDGNPRTAWCEGADGAGEGQWIAFDLPGEVTLKEIIIQPGYFKTEDLWRKNNRLASVQLEFSDKSTRISTFPDEMKEQTIYTSNVKTKSVFIKINRIYPGAADSKDTLISEVRFVVE